MNRCMAHRGWSGKAPENTMAAINLVLEEPKIEAIEIDVQLTKDGVPVVIHDFTLERTTNGTGFVGHHTYEELAALDAGSWFAPAFQGEPIPMLEEVLEAVKGKCQLNIELKKPGDRYIGLEKKVVELIRQYDMQADVMITSFNHDAIRTVSSLDDGIRTGLIIYGMPTLLEEQLRETGASILSMAYPYLTKDFVARMIGNGMTLIAWTIDDPHHIEQTMMLHPELQIVTNHPDRMLGLR
jgi:glycerophosphoryl diester phosphodiesterase